MNAWGDFTQQAGFVDVSPDCGIKDLQTIFIAANVEEDKTSAESKVNFARALHRFEFLECIIRVALAAYHTEKTTASIVAAIDKLVQEHFSSRFDKQVASRWLSWLLVFVHGYLRRLWYRTLLACMLTTRMSWLPFVAAWGGIQSQEAHNCDDFRRERLYTEAVDLMLRPRMTHLKHLFDAFVGIRKSSSTLATEMLLARWLSMLEKLELLDDDFSRREGILCFTWSKMLVVDELLHRDKFICMSFYGKWHGVRCGFVLRRLYRVLFCCCVLVGCCCVQQQHDKWRAAILMWVKRVTDFIEALARAADWSSVPNDGELSAANARDTFQFFENLSKDDGDTCAFALPPNKRTNKHPAHAPASYACVHVYMCTCALACVVTKENAWFGGVGRMPVCSPPSVWRMGRTK